MPLVGAGVGNTRELQECAQSRQFLMAIGALRTLRKAGRRVPEDVAVVGFDDIEATAYTAPALTSVRGPVADQAIATVHLLLGLIEGGPGEPVVIPHELVVRAST
ncbi:substrate-binding domain-containing protein [Streptomyces sp. S1]|uniref:substrate-binding domain-containing protein n=1 Tax=Streptomyces sp. S1 TaxID=718288 RepID=UPI001F09F610|nr:substrate-binding domain-containing protein [Streptomyces sp. S1]